MQFGRGSSVEKCMMLPDSRGKPFIKLSEYYSMKDDRHMSFMHSGRSNPEDCCGGRDTAF